MVHHSIVFSLQSEWKKTYMDESDLAKVSQQPWYSNPGLPIVYDADGYKFLYED